MTADLFDPRHIVVVGASDQPASAGARFVRALVRAGYAGRISTVHPRAIPVEGAIPFTTLDHCPDPVDHVVVAVGASGTTEHVAAACARSARTVHVFSSGFAEAGSEGRAHQDELAAIVRGTGTRLIGPNCLGAHRPSRGITFRDDVPLRAGSFGLVSQSGGVAIAAVRLADRLGVGTSTVVSYGNGADLGAAELIGIVANDPDTRVLGVYVESADEKGLAPALAEAAARMPVVLWASGVSATSVRAARLHTGLRGGPLGDDTAFDRCLRVASVDELVEAVAALSARPRPGPGRGIAFASISGGYCVTFAALADRLGESLPPLATATSERLSELFGASAANVTNPVDLGGAGYLSRGRLQPLLATLGADPAVGSVVFHLAHDYVKEANGRVPGYDDAYVDSLIEAIDRSGVATAVYFPRVEDDPRDDEARRRLREAGLLVGEDAGRLLQVLALTRPGGPGGDGRDGRRASPAVA